MPQRIAYLRAAALGPFHEPRAQWVGKRLENVQDCDGSFQFTSLLGQSGPGQSGAGRISGRMRDRSVRQVVFVNSEGVVVGLAEATRSGFQGYAHASQSLTCKVPR
jgi:hypothetical protein